MKAEIGFARDWGADGRGDGRLTERLRLTITAGSESEGSMLQTFAKRMGLTYDPCSGQAFIEEPAKPG